MDWERDAGREAGSGLARSLALTQWGFLLIVLALGMVCADVALELAMFFAPNRDARLALFRLLTNDGYRQAMSWGITWSSVAGMYLLWGRWRHGGWQGRAGFLALLAALDVALWLIEQAPRWSLTEGPPEEYAWTLANLSRLSGWVEFALIASLAGDLTLARGARRSSVGGDPELEGLRPIGEEEAGAGYELAIPEGERAFPPTWAMPLLGGMYWLLLATYQTDWEGGWPLQPRDQADVARLFAHLFLQAFWGMTAWVTCLIAWRAAGRCRAELTALGKRGDPSGTDF